MLFAVLEYARAMARQQTATLVAATAFFLIALWIIAPATDPVVNWARTVEPLRVLVLVGWLAGVPLLLGGIAGGAERGHRIGAILLGAGLAYVTPVSRPFDSAVCDLCVGPGRTDVPVMALFMTPLGAALLAGFGAWTVIRFRRSLTQD